MASYSAGSASVSIIPDFSGFVTRITGVAGDAGQQGGQVFGRSFNDAVKQAAGGISLGPSATQSSRQGDSSGGYFADSFKKRVEAAMRTLPDVKVGADTSEPERKIAALRAELVDLSKQTVGVDLSDAEALAKLDELRLRLASLAADSPDVSVKVDLAKATAELAAFRAAVDATTGGGSGGGGGVRGLFKAIGDGASAASASISPMVAGVAMLGPAAVAAGATAVAGLGAVPALLAGIGTAGVAAYLGLSGIPDALKAVTTAQEAVDSGSKSWMTDVQKMNEQLAGLTPAGRSFTLFLANEMLPVFDRMKTAAQSSLLPGLQNALKILIPAFSEFNVFVTVAGKGIGDFATRLATFITSNLGMRELNNLLSLGAGLMNALGDGALNIIQAVLRIGTNATPVVETFISWIERGSQAILNWADSGGFTRFIGYVERVGPQVGQVFKDLVSALTNIGKAAAGAAGSDLTGIRVFLEAIGRIPVPVLTVMLEVLPPLVLAIKAFGIAIDVVNGVMAVFDVVTSPVTLIIGAILLAVAALGLGVYELATHWSQVWGDIKNWAADAWHFLDGIWQHIEGGVRDAWQWIQDHLGIVIPIVVGIVTGPIGALVAVLATHWNTVKADVAAAWDWVAAKIGMAWGGIANGLSWVYHTLIQPVFDVFKGALGDLEHAFDVAVWAISVAWGKVENVVKDPVRWVLQYAINDGLIGAWDFVADHLAPGLHINPVPIPFATGGVLPGYAPGVDSVLAMLSPGEGILRPEVVKALGPETIYAWNQAAVQGKIPRFALGGILDDIGGAVSSAAGSVGNFLGNIGADVWDLFKDAAGHLLDPVSWLLGKLTGALVDVSGMENASPWGRLVGSVPRGLLNLLEAAGKSFFGIFSEAPAGGGGGVDRWAGVVGQALSLLGENPILAGIVLRRMNQESGGNPTAVNRSDINWARGTPSVGLMQVIGPTFAA